jgi:hypothetical protein
VCDDDPNAHVTCVEKTVSCDAAEHAAYDDDWGMTYCWRECMGLRN